MSHPGDVAGTGPGGPCRRTFGRRVDSVDGTGSGTAVHIPAGHPLWRVIGVGATLVDISMSVGLSALAGGIASGVGWMVNHIG